MTEQFHDEIIFWPVTMSEMRLQRCNYCGCEAYSRPSLNLRFDVENHQQCKPKRKRKAAQ